MSASSKRTEFWLSAIYKYVRQVLAFQWRPENSKDQLILLYPIANHNSRRRMVRFQRQICLPFFLSKKTAWQIRSSGTSGWNCKDRNPTKYANRIRTPKRSVGHPGFKRVISLQSIAPLHFHQLTDRSIFWLSEHVNAALRDWVLKTHVELRYPATPACTWFPTR